MRTLVAGLALALLGACNKQPRSEAVHAPGAAPVNAAVADAARPDAAPPDAAAPDAFAGRPHRENTGTCAFVVEVPLGQARRERVPRAHAGALGCPDRILHGVVFEPGAAPETGEVHLADQMTLERHKRGSCVYQAMIGCR